MIRQSTNLWTTIAAKAALQDLHVKLYMARFACSINHQGFASMCAIIFFMESKLLFSLVRALIQYKDVLPV